MANPILAVNCVIRIRKLRENVIAACLTAVLAESSVRGLN